MLVTFYNAHKINPSELHANPPSNKTLFLEKAQKWQKFLFLILNFSCFSLRFLIFFFALQNIQSCCCFSPKRKNYKNKKRKKISWIKKKKKKSELDDVSLNARGIIHMKFFVLALPCSDTNMHRLATTTHRHDDVFLALALSTNVVFSFFSPRLC